MNSSHPDCLPSDEKYRVVFGICSEEVQQLVPDIFNQGRSMHGGLRGAVGIAKDGGLQLLWRYEGNMHGRRAIICKCNANAGVNSR